LIAQTDPTKLFYIDEAGIQEYIYREYAKAKKGIRVIGKISGKRYVRTSIISARNNNHKFIAPFIFNGMTDTELVLFWVKEVLLPALPVNSILVWDNAAFHKSEKLRELIEKNSHTMLFLPPYSPDLNPIEHKWQELKQRLRSYYDESVDFFENLIRQVNYMSSLDIG